MHRCFVGWSFGSLALVLLAEGVGSCQEPAAGPPVPHDSKAAHRARMKALASTFDVFAEPQKPESKVAFVPQPVLHYADNTRHTHESSLWICGDKGRPSAVVAIEFYPEQRSTPPWLYEVASLSTGRIAARRGDDWNWTAKQPGLTLLPLPEADPPASRPAPRLAQMKALRARFAAYEQANIEGRIELRPLTSPLHRYADPASGLVDGAIFSFASGTNPEVLLVLEAHESDGKSFWVYGLVRLTGEPVTAQLDGRDIWQRGPAVPPTVGESYVNGWIEFDPLAE